MAKSELVIPKFKITLTAEQTLAVGRLTVIWGQIDHLVLNSVTLLLTKDSAAGTTLLGELTTGPLINLLNKSRHRIDNDEIKLLTKEFCKNMGALIDERNHIMHGMWGLYLPGKNPKKARPGCLYLKNSKKPIFPDDVIEIANKAAKETYSIAKIWCYLAGADYPEGHPKFYFGPHEPRMPKGMKLKEIGPHPPGYQTE